MKILIKRIFSKKLTVFLKTKILKVKHLAFTFKIKIEKPEYRCFRNWQSYNSTPVESFQQNV